MPQATTNNKFRIRAKTALLKRGETIVQLAARIGHPRSVVSKAINSPGNPFPNVRRKVARELKISA